MSCRDVSAVTNRRVETVASERWSRPPKWAGEAIDGDRPDARQSIGIEDLTSEKRDAENVASGAGLGRIWSATGSPGAPFDISDTFSHVSHR